MNEVLNCIKTRRSVRSYKSDMPTMEQISAILEAGVAAPTGRNCQGVIFVAITDKETRDRYSKANAAVMGADTDPFYNAPVIIITLTEKGSSCYEYNGPIALENMMLAAHSMGLGSCWIHRAKEVFEQEEWKEWLRSLGIEGEYEGVGNLALGYIDGEYPPEKSKNPGRIIWVK